MWCHLRIDAHGDGVIELYPLLEEGGEGPDRSVAISIMMCSTFQWAKGAPKRIEPKVEILMGGAERQTPARAAVMADGLGLAAKIGRMWMNMRLTYRVKTERQWLRLLRSELPLPPEKQ